MTWSITILASLGVPCACSPTIRYVLCPFCTVELDPTCSMKTNQGFSAWDELGSSFENHQPVTGIAWNGAFCNVFFYFCCRISCTSRYFMCDVWFIPRNFVGSSRRGFEAAAYLAFVVYNYHRLPRTVAFVHGHSWVQNSRLWKKKTGKTPGFIGHCLFSPNGCICGSSHIQWNTLAHNEL